MRHQHNNSSENASSHKKTLSGIFKKPHLDHTQALSSHVSGSFGTPEVFLAWDKNSVPKPCHNNHTKESTSQGVGLLLKTMYKNDNAYKEFSSTSLNANAKVPYRLSSYSGARKDTTQKESTSQGVKHENQSKNIKSKSSVTKNKLKSHLWVF